MISILLGIVAVVIGACTLMSDEPGDIKLWLGVLPVFCGVMLLLGYK